MLLVCCFVPYSEPLLRPSSPVLFFIYFFVSVRVEYRNVFFLFVFVPAAVSVEYQICCSGLEVQRYASDWRPFFVLLCFVLGVLHIEQCILL